ncbi:MAG: ABC transporter permease [Hyphomicrobiales bacterium]
MAQELMDVLATTFWMIIGIVGIFAIVLTVSGLVYFVSNFIASKKNQMRGYASQKTVTFGDESSVTANRVASVGGVVTVFVIWMIATGSSLLPFQVLPTPFIGDTQFEYTATNAAGETDTATVKVRVNRFGDTTAEQLVAPETSDGFAKDDVVMVQERRAKLLRAQNNDEGGKEKPYRVTEINGQPIDFDQTVEIENATVLMTKAGSLQVRPYAGPTMESLYLPPPERVWIRFLELNAEGYQGVGLWENVMWSLIRVILGFFLGCLFGIPLGFAMGLNSWVRGWFDPIVEFMRPVPPLALIPLVIIWFGIGEQGKISLLFLAALWIMIIGARAGVSGVNISKVHAAYSLGATKTQLLKRVILPNSLPEIFTAARVAMGVCWGTVVAAELVAAEKGAGKMIIAASKFQLTEIVIIGIIIIGVIGFGIDVLMRMAENKLVPWKGKA